MPHFITKRGFTLHSVCGFHVECLDERRLTMLHKLHSKQCAECGKISKNELIYQKFQGTSHGSSESVTLSDQKECLHAVKSLSRKFQGF
jgi:hypothetical protein